MHEEARSDKEAPGDCQDLRLLHRCMQVFVSTHHLDQVLGTVLEHVRDGLGVVASSIWLLDVDTGQLVCRYVTDPKRELVLGWRLDVGKGIAGWVADHNQSLMVTDTRYDPRHFPEVDRLTGIESRSILAVPLRVKDELIGVVEVVDTLPDRFGPSDLSLIESLQAAASIAIENARLYEDSERLRRFNQNIVQNLQEGIVVEDEKGCICCVNPQLAKTLGYTPQEMVGNSWQDYVTDEKRDQVAKIPAQLTRDNPVRYEASITARDGTVVPFIVGSSALFQGDQQVGTLSALTDITDRKKSEEGLKASEKLYRRLAAENEHLMEQARQDADTKTRLLHEVNHRVKNTLSVILGLICTRQRYAKDRDQAAYGKVLAEMNRWIQGLTAAHGLISDNDWGPLLLSELSARVVRSTLVAQSQKWPVSVSVSPSLVRVTPRHASSLALIFSEATANTVEHCLSQGQCSLVEVDITNQEDQAVVVRFRDNGPGFPESVLENRHAGMGLPLIWDIATYDLEGSATFHNDGGAVVTVQFVTQASPDSQNGDSPEEQ